MKTNRTISTSTSPQRLRVAAIVLFTLMLLVCGGVTSNLTSTATARVATLSHATNPLLGIAIPIGALLNDLPPGVTDYIRKTWPGFLPNPPATNPPLGVDLPAGATRNDLPPGITDYLRR